MLSLDVAAGACVGTLFIAKYLQVALPFSCVLALGICVWLIYTADHLIDAWRTKHQAHSARHYFHQKYFKIITLIFFISIFCSATLLFFLPLVVVKWGIVLATLVGAYFLLLFYLRPSLWFHKEVAAAVLYTSGVFLAPVSLSGRLFSANLLIVFLQFFLIALMNLLIFSWFDEETDQADGHTSLARLAGAKSIRRLLAGLGITVTISALLFLLTLPVASSMFKVEALFFAMALTLLGLVFMPSFFRSNERYRIVGDSIFFYPLLMLWFL